MRQITEERVVVDDRPVTAGRAGTIWNPAPIIGAVVVAVLVLLLILFALGHRSTNGRSTPTRSPGVTVTTPHVTGSGSPTTAGSTSATTSGSVKTSAP